MQKIYGLLYAIMLLFGLRCYADTKFTFNNMTSEAITIFFFAFSEDNNNIRRHPENDETFHIRPWAQLYKKVSSKVGLGSGHPHLCYQIAIAQPGTKLINKVIEKGLLCNDTSWNITKNKKGEFVFQRK